MRPLLLLILLFTATTIARAQAPATESLSPDLDPAIARGLAYLARQQQPDGSFTPTADSTESDAGPSYRTSMAVLALTVPYHYLPLYQTEKH